MQVSDLNLTADRLAQFAKAMNDTSGSNAALQVICNSAVADVSRLTAGYVIDPGSLTKFARSLALFDAYSQIGQVPPDIETAYKNANSELQSIARGERPNLPKVSDPNQSTIAGGWGSGSNNQSAQLLGRTQCGQDQLS